MADQPKLDPFEPSEFFTDGSSARPPESGTVARDHLKDDPHLYSGRRGPQFERIQAASLAGQAGGGNVLVTVAAAAARTSYVDTFPFPVTKDVMKRGQDRYRIFCSVCHGPLGNGDGKIVERGFTPPPSYHTDRLRNAPVGYLFDVITNGFGAMPDHAALVPPRDRWAIIAYIRALQLSQHAPLEKLPESDRRRLTTSGDNRDG